MRQADRAAGFTLIEVSLAIVVGILVVAGSVALFQQSKVSAQNSAAKEKLMSLSMLIEEIDQRNYSLPTMTQLRTHWKTRRPDDYNKSPWGGTFTVDPVANNCVDGNDAVGVGVEIGNGPGGTAQPGTTVADQGRVYYYRRDPNVAGRPYIWLDELSVYAAEDPLSVVRVSDYGVAVIGPDGRQWYFVEGKKKTNTAGGPTTAEGQIGD